MELNRTSSEVALPEFHKKSYRPSFNCCFGQSTFQSLVLLSLILLHVVLIVIFLPLVSSSIVRLNEIVDRVDAINSKIDAIDSKVDAIDGKIKKLDEGQIQIEGKVLSLLEACFDLISTCSLHMKIQIMGGKITENLRFKSPLWKVNFFCPFFFFSFSNSP